MKVEIAGVDKGSSIGVRIYDENDYEHRITINWGGEVIVHEVSEYPNDPADRTDEQQRIMSRVEARALYAAHQEFPEAGLVDPQWDPDHLERGIEALSAYPLDEFTREFRDFYETIRNPREHIPHDDVNIDRVRVFKPFTITGDNRIDTVYDRYVLYERENGAEAKVGTIPEVDQARTLALGLPPHDFGDDFEYESDFAEIALQHLLAQVRDVYYHMGEEPPDECKVQGWGKFNHYGDGVTEWMNVTDADGKPVKPELSDA